jgi:bacterioferritin-associated ferredoxin
MIVCICNVLNESQISGAIEAGARTVSDVYDGCDAIPRCGQCRTDISQMLHKYSTTFSPVPSRADGFEGRVALQTPAACSECPRSCNALYA